MKLRIVIAGGTGLVGSACKELFSEEGYDVVILTRSQKVSTGEVSWDPEKKWIAEDVIENAHAVINVCGQSLEKHRWTRSYKRSLLSSRIEPARFLQKLMSNATHKPSCYIGVSGISQYGDRGTEVIDEDSAVWDDGFLADLVQQWEEAHMSVQSDRKIILRTGVVISSKGGFLSKLITPMWFRLYPYFGTGRQIITWISMDDLTRLMLYCIREKKIEGIFHATAPAGISNYHLMTSLRKVSGRNGFLVGIPAALLRLAFGEMADLLLNSLDVRPEKFMRSGFEHHYPDIESALKNALEKEPKKIPG